MELQMLKVPEVATALGCSIPQAYKLIQRGQIPSVKINGSVRVPRTAFERWLDQQVEIALARCGGGNSAA